MNTSFQQALPLVMILFCALPAGNYMLNQNHGVSFAANIRESAIWGGGFIVFAMIDYILMVL